MANSNEFVGIAEAITLIRDIHEDHLTFVEKGVLTIAYVSRLGTKNAEVWPSDLQVAVNCGVSVRTARTVKASLMSEAKSVLIETEKGFFNGTTGKPTHVAINFPRLRKWAAEDRHRIEEAIADHRAYETTRKAAQRAKIKGDVPANPAGTRKSLSQQSTTSVPANPASVPANDDTCPSTDCSISSPVKQSSEAVHKEAGATSKNLNIDFKQEDSTKDIPEGAPVPPRVAAGDEASKCTSIKTRSISQIEKEMSEATDGSLRALLGWELAAMRKVSANSTKAGSRA